MNASSDVSYGYTHSKRSSAEEYSAYTALGKCFHNLFFVKLLYFGMVHGKKTRPSPQNSTNQFIALLPQLNNEHL